MGRKKASEKKDDYLFRLVYISSKMPLKFDVVDEKGKDIPNFTNVISSAKLHEDKIKDIIKTVEKTINKTKKKEKESNEISFFLDLPSYSDDFSSYSDD